MANLALAIWDLEREGRMVLLCWWIRCSLQGKQGAWAGPGGVICNQSGGIAARLPAPSSSFPLVECLMRFTDPSEVKPWFCYL